MVVGVAMLLGGVLLGGMYADVKQVKTELTSTKEDVATVRAKTAAENSGTQKSLDEIKAEQRDMRQEINRKFDQLLQRTR